MQFLSETDFTRLASYRASPAVSIFIPTHRAGVEVNELQDAQLFKSLLQETRAALEKNGMSPTEATLLSRRGTELLDSSDFWRDQLDGLGVFMGENFFFTLKIPEKVREKVFIGPHFYIVPLFPLLRSKPFFLLVLSKGNARFFKGDRFGLEEVEVQGLPNGMDDVIRYEEKGGQETFRRAGNKEKATFHGHGPGLADEEEYVGMYLKEIDRTLLGEVLARENAPLLLAGPERLISQYRDGSRYPHLAKQHISGNYEHEPAHVFFEKACAALEPYFSLDAEHALESFYNQSATPRSTTDPFKVLPGCFQGKIADLFIRDDLHIRGEFNPETGQVHFKENASMETDCLVNQGAVQAYLTNGNVHVLRAEKMPEGSKVAALMRW
ncbi:MAG: hypothetical protein FWJ85_09030 [Solitalea sp.]